MTIIVIIAAKTGNKSEFHCLKGSLSLSFVIKLLSLKDSKNDMRACRSASCKATVFNLTERLRLV